MSKFRFKPEDFIKDTANESQPYIRYDECVRIANKLLEEHEKTLQHVWSNEKDMEGIKWFGRWKTVKDENDTHTALLWNVEEIKDEDE